MSNRGDWWLGDKFGICAAASSPISWSIFGRPLKRKALKIATRHFNYPAQILSLLNEGEDPFLEDKYVKRRENCSWVKTSYVVTSEALRDQHVEGNVTPEKDNGLIGKHELLPQFKDFITAITSNLELQRATFGHESDIILETGDAGWTSYVKHVDK
ncbi:hypothetical protein CC78DRAFT_541306 [Lojkania enalia]|uniref:Uncharacterized protein n=1 Tax=Lojkania enalia TaxID=147567 RepID=A0A9P4N6Y2_9PLEO|nr:hypothetical protein CC78DRAFT_541306 [Didymosphaeria enalia]